MADKENDKKSAPVILSITKLMSLYKESLLSLVPELEKTGLLWNSFEENEDIEAICESLFNLIVRNKLSSFITDKYSITPNITKYAFHYKNYHKLDCIEVSLEAANHRLVFLMVQSVNGPFDTVICDRINENNDIIEREVSIPWDSAEFIFRYVTD